MIQNIGDLYTQHEVGLQFALFAIKIVAGILAIIVSLKKILSEKTPKLKDHSIGNEPVNEFDKHIQNNAANDDVARVAIKQIKLSAGYKYLAAAMFSFILFSIPSVLLDSIPWYLNLNSFVKIFIRWVVLLGIAIYCFIKFCQHNELYHDKRRILKRASEFGHSKQVLMNPERMLNEFYATKDKDIEIIKKISNSRDKWWAHLDPREKYRKIKFVENKASSPILVKDIWDNIS